MKTKNKLKAPKFMQRKPSRPIHFRSIWSVLFSHEKNPTFDLFVTCSNHAYSLSADRENVGYILPPLDPTIAGNLYTGNSFRKRKKNIYIYKLFPFVFSNIRMPRFYRNKYGNSYSFPMINYP